jgi:hypothetical protein
VIGRRGVLTFALVVGVGLAALLATGAGAGRSRAFSLGVPNVATTVKLAPGHRACDSGIADPASFDAIRAYAAFVVTREELDVTVSDAASRHVLARGHAVITPAGRSLADPQGAPLDTGLNATVPAHRQLTVCFVGDAPTTVDLVGSAQVNPSVRLTVDGVDAKPAIQGLALVMLGTRSPLSLVPAMFTRAALFRPSWVGAWTFWLLTVALLATLGLAGVAVASAGTDGEDGGNDGDQVR